MKDHISLLKRILDRKKIKFWTITDSQSSRHELYTIFNRQDTSRSVRTRTLLAGVWVDHKEAKVKYTGNTQIPIPSGAGAAEVGFLANQAVAAAKLVKNPFYEIKQEPYNYRQPDNLEPAAAKSPEECLRNLRRAVSRGMSGFNDVVQSASEYFVDIITTRFLNSAGNEYKSACSVLTLETVFLAGPQRETEAWALRRAYLAKYIDAEKLAACTCRYAVDGLKAGPPPCGKSAVLFSEDALANFFNFFKTHSAAFSFYNKFSAYEQGKPIIKTGTGDPLTMISNPFLPGVRGSRCADAYGFPLKKFTVIENSELKNIHADLKYAQYLNLPFTGAISNAVISGGKHTFNELLKEDGTLLLVKFSSFYPNDITGNFSAEIRLGYLYRKGRLIPVKGGAVSGNIRDLSTSWLLSKETMTDGSYCGPRGIKLYNVDVVS